MRILCVLLLVVSVMGLGGCASMNEQGRMVETVGPEQVRGMTFVGNVSTAAPLAGVAFQHASYQGAMNAALNERPGWAARIWCWMRGRAADSGGRTRVCGGKPTGGIELWNGDS